MGFSSLANQIRESTKQRSPRNGATIDTFLIHHQAGTNDDAVINEAITGSKQVSMTYTISNEGRITGVVDENWRPWTSGSTTDGGKGAAWDRRSITVEIENESAGGDWPISEAALQAAANLLADIKTRYNIVNVLGHRDLWNLYRASYATFCPGPNTVANVAGRVPGVTVGAPVISGAGAGASINYAFGLSTAAQLAAQQALARLGRYRGDQDGRFGGQSVSALQQYLKDTGYLPASYVVDGEPGTVYGTALQTMLADKFGYTGLKDGKPGDLTSAALERWAAAQAPTVPQVITTPTPAGSDWSYWEPSGELGKRVQRALKARGRYAGKVDGDFGELTRKGVQLTLKTSGIFVGNIDGRIERGGTFGIQQYAKKFGSYTGPIDGAPREASWTGFALGLERP